MVINVCFPLTISMHYKKADGENKGKQVNQGICIITFISGENNYVSYKINFTEFHPSHYLGRVHLSVRLRGWGVGGLIFLLYKPLTPAGFILKCDVAALPYKRQINIHQCIKFAPRMWDTDFTKEGYMYEPITKRFGS